MRASHQKHGLWGRHLNCSSCQSVAVTTSSTLHRQHLAIRRRTGKEIKWTCMTGELTLTFLLTALTSAPLSQSSSTICRWAAHSDVLQRTARWSGRSSLWSVASTSAPWSNNNWTMSRFPASHAKCSAPPPRARLPQPPFPSQPSM